MRHVARGTADGLEQTLVVHDGGRTLLQKLIAQMPTMFKVCLPYLWNDLNVAKYILYMEPLGSGK